LVKVRDSRCLYEDEPEGEEWRDAVSLFKIGTMHIPTRAMSKNQVHSKAVSVEIRDQRRGKRQGYRHTKELERRKERIIRKGGEVPTVDLPPPPKHRLPPIHTREITRDLSGRDSQIRRKNAG
jgi:hypothetical protein